MKRLKYLFVLVLLVIPAVLLSGCESVTQRAGHPGYLVAD